MDTLTLVRQWVDTATFAPSVHNTQPWRWAFRAPTISLWADPTRLLTADPDGRDLIISCGAALHHLEVAMRYDGRNPLVTLSETCGVSSPLATVVVGGRHTPTPRDIALRDAIDRRRSDRRAFRHGPVTETVEDADTHCAAYGVTLVVLPEDARAALTEIAEAGNAARRYDSARHHEMHWWTGHDRPDEGIPPALLVDHTTRRTTGGREFPTGTLATGDRIPDEATWLVLTTNGDTPRHWFAVGRALSVVLLSATAAHMATCPVSHKIQFPAARAALRRVLSDHGVGAGLDPQILVRVGAVPFPPPTRWTPRRPLDEVFTDAAP